MYKEKAEALWGIIDDIDTLSDIIKPATEKGYKAFYDAVMKKQTERHKYLTSYDGYTLVTPELHITENTREQSSTDQPEGKRMKGEENGYS